MGSAVIQGPLWGTHAQDWVRMQEQTALPLFGAGLEIAGRGEVNCPFVYPNVEFSLCAQLSSGVIQRAIGHSGEDAVDSALTAIDRDYSRDDGSMSYDDVFVRAAGARP